MIGERDLRGRGIGTEESGSMRGKYDAAAARGADALDPSVLIGLSASPGKRIARAVVPGEDFDFYHVQVYKAGKKDPIAFLSPIWMDNR